MPALPPDSPSGDRVRSGGGAPSEVRGRCAGRAERRWYRIHFTKAGPMRWIGHRDLVRVFERLLRRAGAPLAMSEGFHPHARLRFASALGVGIEGRAEWVEVQLLGAVEPKRLLEMLRLQSVPGLAIDRIEPAEGRIAQVVAAVYEVDPPAEARRELAERIRKLLASPRLPVKRDDRPEPVDVRPGIQALTFDGRTLRFRLAAGRAGAVRPRELLALLDGASWERAGAVLRRVQLITDPNTSGRAEDEREDPPGTIHPSVLESLNENGL